MSGCCSPEERIVVEVERVVVDGATCDRCGSTWDAARAAVTAVAGELAGLGVAVDLQDRPLTADRVADSNRVLVNGRSVEEWLGATVVENECASCSDLLGEPTCCRAYEFDGVLTESLSAEHIAQAIRRAAGIAPAAAASERGAASALLRVTIVTSDACG